MCGHTYSGLILTVLPSGRRQFTLRYRYQGKHRRLILGDDPQLTLAQARRRARQAQVAIVEGGDPVGDRRMAKAPPTDTVAALAADYLANTHACSRRARLKTNASCESMSSLTGVRGRFAISRGGTYGPSSSPLPRVPR